MKFSAILAVAFLATVVSAAPRRHRGGNKNKETNINREDNSNHQNKQINQGIGSVGSSSGGGLLGGLLGGGVLSKNSNTNNVGQNAVIN